MATAHCAARSSRTGEPCQAYPVRGAAVCIAHGGAAAQVKAAAAGRVVEQAARRQLARLNMPPVEDPLTALAAITGEVIAWKDSIGGKVNELTSIRYEGDGSGGEQLRAEVALWERALDRCERFLTAMARLDIDDRLARITEARATAVLVVFIAALDAAGIEGPQRDAVIAAADSEFARQAGVML